MLDSSLLSLAFLSLLLLRSHPSRNACFFLSLHLSHGGRNRSVDGLLGTCIFRSRSFGGSRLLLCFVVCLGQCSFFRHERLTSTLVSFGLICKRLGLSCMGSRFGFVRSMDSLFIGLLDCQLGCILGCLSVSESFGSINPSLNTAHIFTMLGLVGHLCSFHFGQCCLLHRLMRSFFLRLCKILGGHLGFGLSLASSLILRVFGGPGCLLSGDGFLLKLGFLSGDLFCCLLGFLGGGCGSGLELGFLCCNCSLLLFELILTVFSSEEVDITLDRLILIVANGITEARAAGGAEVVLSGEFIGHAGDHTIHMALESVRLSDEVFEGTG